MMETDVQNLALMIKEKLGIDMLNNLDSLKRKIKSRLDELNISIWEYIRFVKENEKEWDKIIDIVTINETYFFREEEQLDEFKKEIKSFDKNHIRVWCAACSTGEEPYTLSMLLKENLPIGTTFEVVASDINKDVVDFAKKGFYQKNSLSFRRLDDSTIRKYFEDKENGYEVKKEYKENVSFTTFNLVGLNWFAMKDFDVIFCRNVLIYFDEKTVKDIVKNFYYSLGEKGSLYLGHSDPYRQIYDKFKFIRTPQTLFLKKGDIL